MASPQQPSAGSCPTAQVVGNAFVHQYYHILHQSPELVFRFYQDTSKLGRPEPDGTLSSITTMDAINQKILSLDYSDCIAEIKTVDAQESHNGGVIVLVTGYLTGKDGLRRNFTQSFFLAPQDKGYFVLNDLFRYVEVVEHQAGSESLPNGVAALTPEQEPAPVAEQTSTLREEEVNSEEVYDPSDNEEGSVVEEEAPVAEVVDEIPNNTQMVAESNTAALEELPKKSYASIVKVKKENGGPTPPPAWQAPSNQERTVAPTPPPAEAAEAPVSSSNATDGGNNQEGESDGHSIYIKNLPLNATPAQLEEEFKKFGPIKSDGVQVRSNKQQGFCFGFVEFEVATAVQSAIERCRMVARDGEDEDPAKRVHAKQSRTSNFHVPHISEASPITIGGRQAVVEEKRPSSSRVNNRGRFPSGRGNGFRNDGARGRGNYGNGRGYGRNDFNNRSDFGNRSGSGSRGGSLNRGVEGGNQRADHGGRVSRTGGLAVNGSAKNVASRVPAPA
ncbi:nuclear transport factor 2-like isoform X1 [Macadamia integrifolia]|uniref:nuclear transport factor 2-like isoform X1 n=1 Tax=Macadamia integrifolia TaxID=60698 RepID=UPI001C4EEB4A|nr:nuclear transport factor 2-like isoform X1 [Macadamia integrifolia]